MQEIQAYIFPFCARILGNTESQAGFSIVSQLFLLPRSKKAFGKIICARKNLCFDLNVIEPSNFDCTLFTYRGRDWEADIQRWTECRRTIVLFLGKIELQQQILMRSLCPSSFLVCTNRLSFPARCNIREHTPSAPYIFAIHYVLPYTHTNNRTASLGTAEICLLRKSWV